MKRARSIYSLTAVGATVLVLLLGGCASTAEKGASADDSANRATQVRCPAGFTLVCEAQKTGRIRFGRMGKENLESCACEPEGFSAGRAQQSALPQ